MLKFLDIIDADATEALLSLAFSFYSTPSPFLFVVLKQDLKATYRSSRSVPPRGKYIRARLCHVAQTSAVLNCLPEIIAEMTVRAVLQLLLPVFDATDLAG